MESFVSGYFIFPIILLIFWWFVRFIYGAWWKPKSLEKYFKSIGIEGTSYKLFYGDTKASKNLMAQAWSKPMPLSHIIVPRVNPMWHRMVQNYGKISLSWHERRPRLLVADAGLMRDILNDKNGHFRKPPTNPLVDLLTLGVSTLEGLQWKKRRNLITPSFHHEKILGMVPTFLTSCSDMIRGWKEKLVDLEGKFEVDVAIEMQRLTSDIIARAAFGTSFDEVKMIFELQKEQVVLTLEAFYAFYFPGLRFVPTKKNRRRYEIDNKIKAILKDMIIRKQRKLESGKSEDDLLSLLLQCQNQTDNDMTVDDVMEECKLFYFAGQETTANWLTWTMIVLSMHPTWQDRARTEVVDLFGKSTPDVKTLNQLKIVPMILQEVLRLYPPVTGLYRYTNETTQIGDAIIPAGVEIVLPTMAIHHDRDYWGADADEFRPERFSEGVSRAAKDDQAAFFPFGWGPRFCLGQSFAMIEAKLAMTMILQNFSFDLSPAYAHAPHTIITLQPQYGAPLLLQNL
ncbi:hypothetical protein C2S51_012576 [Perilla frutescens var. frutescens]|nr:hypothetical protein C2S51_012576 [Perilla frutescens var. frutescens]